MEEHSFDIQDAINFGLEEAILIHKFKILIYFNKTHNQNFFEERYWTCNSNRTLSEIFPYWTARKIQTYLKSLIDKGILMTGNFNNNAYDRTLYYAFCAKRVYLYEKHIN